MPAFRQKEVPSTGHYANCLVVVLKHNDTLVIVVPCTYLCKNFVKVMQVTKQLYIVNTFLLCICHLEYNSQCYLLCVLLNKSQNTLKILKFIKCSSYYFSLKLLLKFLSHKYYSVFSQFFNYTNSSLEIIEMFFMTHITFMNVCKDYLG